MICHRDSFRSIVDVHCCWLNAFRTCSTCFFFCRPWGQTELSAFFVQASATFLILSRGSHLDLQVPKKLLRSCQWRDGRLQQFLQGGALLGLKLWQTGRILSDSLHFGCLRTVCEPINWKTYVHCWLQSIPFGGLRTFCRPISCNTIGSLWMLCELISWHKHAHFCIAIPCVCSVADVLRALQLIHNCWFLKQIPCICRTVDVLNARVVIVTVVAAVLVLASVPVLGSNSIGFSCGMVSWLMC